MQPIHTRWYMIHLPMYGTSSSVFRRRTQSKTYAFAWSSATYVLVTHHFTRWCPRPADIWSNEATKATMLDLQEGLKLDNHLSRVRRQLSSNWSSATTRKMPARVICYVNTNKVQKSTCCRTEILKQPVTKDWSARELCYDSTDEAQERSCRHSGILQQCEIGPQGCVNTNDVQKSSCCQTKVLHQREIGPKEE